MAVVIRGIYHERTWHLCRRLWAAKANNNQSTRMKENQHLALHGHRVVLVPYRNIHVPKYHEWMKSPELQELTASEPLTLDQEREMQMSWAQDQDKCTFIILDKELFYNTEKRHEDEIDCMAGDVNLFFNDQDDRHSAEIEIMIAEPKFRGRGIGKEALFAMMNYGVNALGVRRYTAKIGLGNQPSISMFIKIGFTEVSRSEVFEEMTLEIPMEKLQALLSSGATHIRTVHDQQQS